jgi:hypothetical protein
MILGAERAPESVNVGERAPNGVIVGKGPGARKYVFSPRFHRQLHDCRRAARYKRDTAPFQYEDGIVSHFVCLAATAAASWWVEFVVGSVLVGCHRGDLEYQWLIGVSFPFSFYDCACFLLSVKQLNLSFFSRTGASEWRANLFSSARSLFASSAEHWRPQCSARSCPVSLQPAVLCGATW